MMSFICLISSSDNHAPIYQSGIASENPRQTGHSIMSAKIRSKSHTHNKGHLFFQCQKMQIPKSLHNICLLITHCLLSYSIKFSQIIFRFF